MSKDCRGLCNCVILRLLRSTFVVYCIGASGIQALRGGRYVGGHAEEAEARRRVAHVQAGGRAARAEARSAQLRQRETLPALRLWLGLQGGGGGGQGRRLGRPGGGRHKWTGLRPRVGRKLQLLLSSARAANTVIHAAADTNACL